MYFGDSHDAQKSALADATWRPSEDEGIYLVDAATGELLYKANVSAPPAVHGTDNFNHLTFTDEDTIAWLNCRNCNSITKYDVVDQRTLWRAGGLHGDFDLIDLDGRRYTPGTHAYADLHHGVASMWAGSHNGEYWGDGEYWMFNNGYAYMTDAAVSNGTANFSSAGNDGTFDGKFRGGFRFESSSVMMLKIDEDARTARVAFEYAVEQTLVYGDADRMPTANIVSCNWPARPNQGSYEWRAFELQRAWDGQSDTPGTLDDGARLAWQLEVYGPADHRRNGTLMGWVAYSVERWFDAPLVYNVSCAAARGGGGGARAARSDE